MKTTDPVRGPSRGTPNEVFAFFANHPPRRADAAVACVNEVKRLCDAYGLDFSIAIARIADETGDLNGPGFFMSDIWAARLNPGGLGVTDSNDEMIGFPDGKAAARAYMAHYVAYTIGRFDGGDLTAADDPRWEALPVAWRGSVRTLQDFQGKWFTHPQGAQNTANRGNAIFPNLPNAGESQPTTTPQPGGSTVPTIYRLDRDYQRFGLTLSQANAILNNKFAGRRQGGVQGRPRKIFLHIQAGNTRGSLSYWSGVDASSTVMIQYDGSILQIIPEADGPWTNGDVINPNRAMIADLLAWGGNPNIWSLTIEAEGHPFETRPTVQLDAIEWQVREWMRVYPEITLADIEKHAYVNGRDRPNCPGPYYDEIMRRLNANPTPVPTPTPEPEPEPELPAFRPDWLTERWIAGGEDGALIGPNGTKQKVFSCRRRWQTAKATAFYPHTAPNADALESLQAGTTFIGVGVYRSHGGWWILDEAGRRARMDDMTDRCEFTTGQRS